MTTGSHPAKNAGDLIGHLVCVGLKDGSFYVGRVKQVRKGKLVLEGIRGPGTLHGVQKPAEKAQVAGLLQTMLGGMGAGLGAGMGAGAAATGAGAMGGLGGMWPTLRMGLGMLQFIMPLMGRFFI